MLSADQAKQLYWLVRECYTDLVNKTNSDLKAGCVDIDLHDKAVKVSGEIGRLQTKFTQRVESLSSRELQVLRLCVAYLKRYKAVYRLPINHPERPKHAAKFARLQLAESVR